MIQGICGAGGAIIIATVIALAFPAYAAKSRPYAATRQVTAIPLPRPLPQEEVKRRFLRTPERSRFDDTFAAVGWR